MLEDVRRFLQISNLKKKSVDGILAAAALKRYLLKIVEIDFIDVVTKIFKSSLRNLLDLLSSLLRLTRWFLAPELYARLIKRHAAMFIICTLVYPIVQRLLLSPLKRRLNDAFVYAVFGAAHLRKVQSWRKRMQEAKTYEEWRKAGEELGKIDGSIDWRENPKCKHYDHRRIRSDSATVNRLMATAQVKELMQFLRARLDRNCGGILSTQLYAKDRVGTKHVIEEYVSRVCKALRYIGRAGQTSAAERLAFFNEVRHTYGRSALLVSGGSTFGLYHAGIILELMSHRLLPKVVSGSSIGSLLVSFLSCLSEEEFRKLGEKGGMDFQFFEKKTQRSFLEIFFTRVQRFFRTGYILDINLVRKLVQNVIGDLTFMEAYEKTGRVMNITVMPATAHGLPRILNYLTAPNVVVWSAAICSCAIPGVFQAQELLERDERGELVPFIQEGVEFSDGSFGCDLPMDQLSQLFNVNHFVVSQVNPHIVPFVVDSEVPQIISLSVQLFADEMVCLTRWLCKLGKEYGLGYFSKIFSTIHSLSTQRYLGDITFHPSPHPSEYLKLFSNPNEALKQNAIIQARKRTWGQLSRLKVHCAVEYCLDDCLRQMRGTLIKEAQMHSMSRSEKTTPSSSNGPLAHSGTVEDNQLEAAKEKAIKSPRHSHEHLKSPNRMARSCRVDSWTPSHFDKFNLSPRSSNRLSFRSSSSISEMKDEDSEKRPDEEDVQDEVLKKPQVRFSESRESEWEGSSRAWRNSKPPIQSRLKKSRSMSIDSLKVKSLVRTPEREPHTPTLGEPFEEEIDHTKFLPRGMKKSDLGLPRSLSWAELCNENITSTT